MLDKALRFFVVALMAIVGGAILHLLTPLVTEYISDEFLTYDMGLFKLTLANGILILVGLVIGAGIGSAVSPLVLVNLRKFSLRVERQLNKMPFHDVVAGLSGLAIGLIIANLLGAAFTGIPVIGGYIPIIFSIVFGYLGIHILIRKQNEIGEMFTNLLPKMLREAKEKRDKVSDEKNREIKATDVINEVNGEKDITCKLLDTSVIIDGRIADICRTGFIEGKLLIPVFVLEELQHIADSADSLKRVRGRRGLDVLQRLRTECGMQVEIVNEDFDDITEVDSKLVRLGQLKGGKIITNDFNLNKVSELRGVPVLNINELSNAVKPVVIPGERMDVTVVKEGKEHGQGVAYLDDGTMIVIENGRRFMNEAIRVEVTSALQTAAGRMIFAKPAVATVA